jgi:TatD DNase family protein
LVSESNSKHSPITSVFYREAFISQLEIAKELNKPVVVHCREAHDEVFEILRERLHKEFPIHMHCFTGTDEQAKRLLNQFDNLYLGFTGLIVSRNMDEVIRAVPLNRLLIETDGPYHFPATASVPSKGKRKKVNEPSLIPFIADKLADVLDVSAEEVLGETRKNACRLYKLDFIT